MARAVTWDDLRALATFEAQDGCTISLYVDLDPSVAPTAADAATRVNSLLDEAAKSEAALRRDLTHVQRASIRDDLDRIRRFYAEEFVREGARGLAIFAAGLDNLWRAMPLLDRVDDVVKVGSELHVVPLVPLVGRGDGALVVAVSRERGEILRLRGGRLEDAANVSDDQPRRHDQGGWSQARYQRRIDNLAHEHLRDVAERLDELVRRSNGSMVVVVATGETRAEFDALLSPETHAVVAGWTTAEAHAGSAELLNLALPVVERRSEDDERAAVEHWRESAGRAGRASRGWEQTLEAASDGRIQVLLFQQGIDREAFRCRACGRVAAAPGKCPLDGTVLEARDEGLDLAVHQTLLHGGSARELRQHHDLEPVGGIGALLRY